MGYRAPWGNWIVVGLLVAGIGGVAQTATGHATGYETAGLQTAGLAAVLVVGGRGRTMGGLVGSIALGAAVLGGVAWVVASQAGFLPMDVPVATGLGLAVGGGLGSVAWLALIGDQTDDSTETMTVDMAEDEEAADAVPSPTPADLFDASPDPILFFAEGPDTPVVLAANPAFEAVFGVSGSALDGTPLAEGLLVEADAGEVVAAARDGDAIDRVLTCETDDGRREMRVRLATAEKPAASGGYVLYTPADGS